ncbi:MULTISPECIES: hypothetical protein [unclassified Microcoleus]|uniref:hypothetical protein n=1 Tax=unclassified Microcoleus TaxID=2642155 RepID=UPI002FD071B0
MQDYQIIVGAIAFMVITYLWAIAIFLIHHFLSQLQYHIVRHKAIADVIRSRDSDRTNLDLAKI